MKRFTKVIFALIAALFIAVPAHAALQDMWAYVYKWDGKMSADGKPTLTRLTSGVTFTVRAINTATAETLYVPKSTTALTNPVTTTNFASNTVCNDMVAFRVDPTDATSDRYVDLIVVNTDGGGTAFVEDFDRYNHAIIIDERPGVQKMGAIWWSVSAGKGATEVNTGVTFNPTTYITNMDVEVEVVDTGGTMNVGTLSSLGGGAINGYFIAVPVSTLGGVNDLAVPYGGANMTLYRQTYYGKHIAIAIAGTNAFNDPNFGGITRKNHRIGRTGSNSNVLSYASINATGVGSGLIRYFYIRQP